MDEDNVDIPWSEISSGEGPASATPPVQDPPPASPPPAEPDPPPVDQPPPGDTPQEQATEDDAGQVGELPVVAGKPKQYRFRPSDPTEVLALEMVRSAEKSGQTLALKDALAQAEKITKPEGSPNNPPPADSNPAKAIDDELATVQAVLDAAAQDESLYTPDIRKAQARESVLLAKKEMLTAQQAQAAEAQANQKAASFQDTEKASFAIAERAYPDLLEPSSPLAKAMAADWNAIAADPQHPLYTLADLPETLAAKHAMRLGIAPKAKAAAAPPPATPPAPRSPLQPVAALPGSRTVVPIQMTDAQKEAASLSALANAESEDALKELLTTDVFGPSRQDGYSFR